MKKIKALLTTLFLATAIAGYGQAPDTPQPVNTKVNNRDRNPAEVTADQQKANAADTELTQKIRQSIMADKSLSTDAHNIKIVSQNGAVTLKGPVKSSAEKKTIMAKAVAVAGSSDKVIDQISIKQ